MISTFIKKIQAAYDAALMPLCEQFGLPKTSVDILLFLANNPEKQTAKDICRFRNLKPGTVSLHVDRLVRDGYLIRGAAADDRRICPLICTSKAHDVTEKGRRRQDLFAEELTRGLSAADIELMRKCFGTVNENLDRIGRSNK